MAFKLYQKNEEATDRKAIEKIIQTNPYSSFDEALTCKCDREEFITPYLRVVSNIASNQSKFQKWLLTNDKQQFFVFENDLDKCRSFDFKKDDLILIKGRLSYHPENLILRLKSKGPTYVEFQGKKYCE